MAARNSGYELWSDVFKGARYIVAPMVDQSELAWRMLSRRYGAELCYTPMLHAAVFTRDANYRKENLQVCPEDRPLVVQFCANDPQTLLQAATLAAPYCDAVDLNLGCPQSIARKGHYGAFLQDEWDLLTNMVSLLHRELPVPITCKIRVFGDIEKTVKYAQMLESAGCQLLTVHGRTREQKGSNMGLASWEHIKAVKQNLQIPVFANGNIQYFDDVHSCFQQTSVDGVMTAEGNLYNPALFTGDHPPCWKISDEYLELVEQYHCPVSYVRGHIFKIWFHVLKQPEYQHYREIIGAAKTFKQLKESTVEIKELLLGRLTSEELTAKYTSKCIPFWRCQPYFRPSPADQAAKRARSPTDNNSDSTDVIHKKKRKELVNKDTSSKKQKWVTCLICKANPKGMKCAHDLCKVCCRAKCRTERLSCSGHRYFTNPQPLNKSKEEKEKEKEKEDKEEKRDETKSQDEARDTNLRTETNRTLIDSAEATVPL